MRGRILRSVLMTAGAVVVMAAMVAVMPAGTAGASTRGRFTNIVFPGSIASVAYQVNDLGVVIGNYTDTASPALGFVDRGGKITTLVDPSAGTGVLYDPLPQGTSPYAINDLGVMVGWYWDSNGAMHGFLLKGGKYTTIDYPGSEGTYLLGISNFGEIAGEYADSSGIWHGFTDINGKFTTIDDPVCAGVGTSMNWMNDFGEMVGSCWDATNPFINRNGTFTPFSGQGSALPQFVNDLGEIAGVYTAANGLTEGFTDINGTFTTIDDPLGDSGYGTYILVSRF